MSNLPVVTLKKNHDHRLLNGHLWVFSNELIQVPDLPSGQLVTVLNEKGESFGTGFFHSKSLISVRLLQTDDEELTSDFFEERIRLALHLRAKLFPSHQSFRVIFGESDLLPGWVVDKYENYLAVQVLSAGMEKLQPVWVSALLTVFPETKGIILKNTSKLRELEGLLIGDQIVFGEIPAEVVMIENELMFSVDLKEGQKTGYFLDQKLNRQRVSDLANGLTVLDCFTNQGGFSLHAAKGGATSVLGLDISEKAIQSCNKNANLNGFSTVSFEVADVFEYLKQAVKMEKHYDMVILDPPSFTKSKKNIPQAKIGYGTINQLALKLISSGGFLVTSSCSHHIEEHVFQEIVKREASKLGRQLRQIFRGNQSPDHPVLLAMEETNYLKFFIYQVL